MQLVTTHRPTLELPASLVADAASAPKILALIARAETAYQTELSHAFADMSEKAFKSLRRALPLTRQKLDWDKARRLCMSFR